MRRESPVKRIYKPTKVNPKGRVAWVARYTNGAGERVLAKPRASFPTRREAQAAIDAAYDTPDRLDTIGDYAATWIERYPRSARTNKSSATRLRAVLDVDVEGQPLRDWPWADLRPRHAEQLIDHMLREQGRAAKGATGILRTLSMMAEDAITDEVAELNFTRGRRIRSNDPRIQTPAVEIRVWSFEQMQTFAAAGRAEIRAKTPRPSKHRQNGSTLYYSSQDYEPMLLTFALTSLRIGEVLALQREDVDGDTLHVRGSAYSGVITAGDTAEKRHVRDVPISPTLAAALKRMPPSDSPLLFPTQKGTVWHDSSFRRDVWVPAQLASGLDIRPHECRHSWITHMRAAGVDAADLAQMSGHDVDTATRIYTKPLGKSMGAVRDLLG